jgi:AI-2 transport protein TqsA
MATANGLNHYLIKPHIEPAKSNLVVCASCLNSSLRNLAKIILEEVMKTDQEAKQAKASSVLIIAASFVIVVAGMRSAQSILVPFLLSIFISIICGPMLLWLRKKGLSTGLALLAVIIAILAAGVLIGVLIGTSIHDFSQSLPFYQERLTEKTATLVSFMGSKGIKISDQLLLEYIDPGAAMSLASNLLSGLGNMLNDIFLILLTVIFILLEASSFSTKLHSVFGSSTNSLENFNKFIATVNSYMAIKTWISLATGALVAIWLSILGVDFPLLWGVLAFMFNYVPNIGSIIAAVPAVLLALIQHGSTTALLAAAGYVAFNIIIGNVIEPRFLGRGLGLSTLVVFLSLVFWGWVLGPVGMFLSIPLTMTVKIALSTNKETQWVNTLLGPTGDSA